MTEQPAGAARTPGEDPIAPESEARRISPFVSWRPGFASVDPADPNQVVFEDFSPRVLDASASDEVYEQPELLPIPKDSSAQEPALSSGSPPMTEPPSSEAPVQPESSKLQEVQNPVTPPAVGTMPSLGPLPFPSSPGTEGVETDDGSPSPNEPG